MSFRLQSFAVTPDKHEKRWGRTGKGRILPKITGPWLFKIQLSGLTARHLACMLYFLAVSSVSHRTWKSLIFASPGYQVPAWMTAGSTLETWLLHPQKMLRCGCSLPTPSMETTSLCFKSNGHCRQMVSGHVIGPCEILPTSSEPINSSIWLSHQIQIWVPRAVLRHEGPNSVLRGSTISCS